MHGFFYLVLEKIKKSTRKIIPNNKDIIKKIVLQNLKFTIAKPTK